MNKLIPVALCLLTTAGYAQNNAKKAIPFAEKQTDLMLKAIPAAIAASTKPNAVSPRTLSTTGELVMIPSKDWVSGFFPGELWYLYEYTHNNKWLTAAKAYTTNIEPEQFDKGTHDVGFKIYCSVGNGYRLTKDAHYKEVIIQAAKTLSTRFNPIVGCIKSWDNRKNWPFPVIIDNMMNLELLFEATKLSGDSTFHKIAVSHANTTMKNHFRPDYSSYHVIDYDPQTGAVLHKQTHQGYADSSAWARGQGWGLYGYTLCYRETRNKAYLQQAEAIAKFIFSHPNLPKDKVPYWDFNAPDIPNAPRDASAAALMASAMYELSTYSSNGKQYKKTADDIMNSLSKRYQAKPGESKGFILLHSTGHKPANSEIDVPISYADYYYLEALLRQNRLANGQSVIVQ
ncbi:glycoside hydrolase family 88 protein [Mucilaginibacter sp. PAMB04168]|uniref:glycoside hydrolase family 88 protein n=1 Tax=Mucilaginibacter sp. PAMB04168 TaxID=3138567 RepID=UPI0031F65AAB